jgi:hypothetical protein
MSGGHTEFTSRLTAKQVRNLAGMYVDESRPEEMVRENRILHEIAPQARKRGHITETELTEMARWKSPRSAPRVRANGDEFVRAVTASALTTFNERLRVEVLTLLDGVEWPTASVLLHFCAADPTVTGDETAVAYPILDFRALSSLGVAPPPRYQFDFWWRYVEYCRDLAQRWRVDMRTLDRALWKHSKASDSAR